MRNFIANEYGRTLVIHLGKGELMLESIQKALDEHGIKNAVLLSAIGSLRKLSMHIIMDTDDNATNNFVVVKSPLSCAPCRAWCSTASPTSIWSAPPLATRAFADMWSLAARCSI